LSAWKDDAGFYGDSDTYATWPATVRERNLLKRNEFCARGFSFPTSQLADEQAEDNERAGLTAVVSEEDMLLPNDAPESMRSLPALLKNACTLISHVSALDLALSRRTKIAKVDGMKDLICKYVFPSSIPSKSISYMAFRSMPRDVGPLFGNADSTVDSLLFLDYLPILRSMAVQERVAEAVFLAAQAQDPNGTTGMTNRKRSTRRSKKLGRKHYFETIPPSSIWDKTDYETPKQVAECLADASLLYYK